MARQKHAAAFGNDLKKIAEDVRSRRAQMDWPVASPIPKPSKNRHSKW